jgi:hypothetical protein
MLVGRSYGFNPSIDRLKVRAIILKFNLIHITVISGNPVRAAVAAYVGCRAPVMRHVLRIFVPAIVNVEFAAKWQALIVGRDKTLFGMVCLVLLGRIVYAVSRIRGHPMVVAVVAMISRIPANQHPDAVVIVIVKGITDSEIK